MTYPFSRFKIFYDLFKAKDVPKFISAKREKFENFCVIVFFSMLFLVMKFLLSQ
ncbi:hypothetical protein UNSWCS_625 [Campylobacter concisus UNSWCS]|uniref:Uncharacterized protein n=1 Tax=Campylobacter concisus UNSWCS TaxID=1242968 RepID=U2F1Q1_9BACT|nr:hypothetical protein UNSWCS_625 [Campylobacter concisus UNSWCS]